MGKIILITGGCRSGKSKFAEQKLASIGDNATYIATAPALDTEMQARIQKHRNDRQKRNWQTIEEQINLAKAIEQANSNVLVDCLTLWLNNLLYKAQSNNIKFTEDSILEPCQKLIQVMQKSNFTTILVTNEIGLGIVPENACTRLFRDCAGQISQQIAHIADEVIFVVAGLPLYIKNSNNL